MRSILKKAARQAGVAKRVYPHLFRHTLATKLAESLGEEQLKKHFGWRRGSDMPGHYVHHSDKSVGNAIDRIHGLPGAAMPEPGLKPWRCPRCGAWNPPTTDLCLRCAGPGRPTAGAGERGPRCSSATGEISWPGPATRCWTTPPESTATLKGGDEGWSDSWSSEPGERCHER